MHLVYNKKHTKYIKMDQEKVRQFVALYGDRYPEEAYNSVKNKFLQMNQESATLCAMKSKNPITALLLSIFLGYLGIDRIYVGDVGLGVIKMLTCGGIGIWWLIDLFFITGITKKKNLEMLVMF